MAKKRLKLKDKQGNVIDYDISAASVTIDAEGKSVEVKLAELVAAIAETVISVTFNGEPHNIYNRRIDLGNQMQPDWEESSPTYPSYVRNKPNVVTGIKVGAGGSTLTPDNGVVTLPESGGQVECDTEMSSTSENAVQNKVVKAYVDGLINGLINGAPAALDTLKELADALGDNDDAIAALTTAIASKANAADVYTKAQTDDAIAGKQDTLTFDNAPTAGSNNPVKSGGIKTAIDNATPTIDPTTKKWIVGGQLTDVVAEGQDGQDGNSGVASADSVESVNNLNGGTTDTDAKVYVLGANQGKVIKDILDKTYRSVSTGDSSTVIVEVTHTLKAGTGDGTLGAAIIRGQRRPGTGGMDNVDTAANAGIKRATVNIFYTRKGELAQGSIAIPFPDKFKLRVPSGLYASVVGSNLINTNGTNDGVWDSPWLEDGGEVDLMVNDATPDPGDLAYYAINFKNPSNTQLSDAELASLNSGFAIEWVAEEEQEIVGPAAGKAMEFIGANGQVAKTVYCKEDNGGNVQVYTKESVDALVGQSPTGIIARNEDAINRIWAARKHYDLTHTTYYPVINHENNFCIAHGSDFHVDVDRLENFRDFVDGVTSIDAAIITGDFTSNGTDAEFNAMMGVEFDRIEPMRCIGNHDRDGGKTLAQIATALDMDNDYYVNDDFVVDFGIRFIVLNRYDVASTTKAIAQRDGHWSQTQIDWFLSKLDESITNGYHVIVAMHAIDNEVGYANIGKRTAPNNKGFWQRLNAVATNQSTKLTVSSGTVIEDIIAAFRTGGSISQSYTFSGNNAPQINVSHSFSGAGKFICYMVGHCHIDMIGYAVKHPDQLYLVAPNSGCIGKDQSTPPQSYDLGTQLLDLPRKEGTKTEDCFNVYGIDTTNKVVKVVRVGADMNDLMEKREVACFDYEPTNQ